LGSDISNRFGGKGYRIRGDRDQDLGFQQENAGKVGMVLFMRKII